MIVIYGQRWYGRGYPAGEQGLATRGLHIYYVPLIPTGQMWITARGNGMVRGVPTKFSWRAAMPIFAVQWTMFAACAIAPAAPVFGIGVAIAAAAAGIWGYLHTHPNTKRARMAREITSGVLGMNCPPELIAKPVLRQLTPGLDKLWSQVSDRPPEDVASLGPRDRREASVAYTLLVVRANLEGGGLGKSLNDQAGKILDAIDRTPQLPQGAPYRAEVTVPDQAG